MSDLIEAANNYKSADKFESRDKYMNYLVSNINQYVDDQRRYNDNRPHVFKRIMYVINPCAGRFLGNYIVILYFLTKFLYIVNTIVQVGFLGIILGKSFVRFGIDFILKLSSGQGWVVESKYFPSKKFSKTSISQSNSQIVITIKYCITLKNIYFQRWHFVIFIYVKSDTQIKAIVIQVRLTTVLLRFVSFTIYHILSSSMRTTD